MPFGFAEAILEIFEVGTDSGGNGVYGIKERLQCAQESVIRIY